MMTQIFRRLFGDERRQRIQEQKDENERLRKLQKDRKVMELILGYPENEMTREEFEKLPHFKDLEWKTCPFGTWFVCQSSDLLPGVIILGHKVDWGELICNQIGARTADYESCYNRYRLKLI